MAARIRKWKRYLLLLLGPLLLVVILISLKVAQIRLLMAKGEEAARLGPPPEAVASATALEQTWEESLPAIGTVTDVTTVELSSQEPGRVTRLHFDSGAVVERGQVLVELDTSVERAELALARSRRDLAQVNARRSRSLYAENVVPLAELQSVEAALDEATEQVAAIEAAIERKTVRAPFAGRLGIREVDLGEHVTAGSRITVLEAAGGLFVDFALPQGELSRVKVGLRVRIAASGDAGADVEGQISAIEPAVDEVTRSFKVRASVADQGGQRLRPGMFVDVAVILPGGRKVVAVPVTAIVHAPYGDSVFVIEDKKPGSPGMSKTPQGKPVKIARQRFVRLGEARGDFVEITQGVEAGQLLVSAGAFKLRNGSPIVVEKGIEPEPSLNPRPENR